jgi:hypothetical protein
MYDLLDVVAEAEERAKSRVVQDRMRYVKFYEAAERFAIENDLVLGGPAATRLLLAEPLAEPRAEPRAEAGPELTLEAFQRYDFFSGRAVPAARALGDAMYALDPDGLAHYTAVVTKVPSYQLAVAVDGRDLFTVTALPVHRGVRTSDVVIPSYRRAQFARDAGGKPAMVACMGPEIQLMGVYASLCNPGAAGDWEELLAVEAKLRALFAREAHAKIASAVTRVADGGGDPSRAKLSRDIYRQYAAGAGRVLVGSAAAALLRGEAPEPSARIQVVAVAPLRAEAAAVARIAAAHGAEVQWTENDPRIPTDPRLRRMTLYLQRRDGRREPFMDVYNAAAHELVPYFEARFETDVGLKVGTPFAVMRFRLADMWAMQVLMQMRAVSPEFGRSTLLEMLGSFEAVAAHYDSEARVTKNAPRLLPVSDYIGRYEDPVLALRRAAQEKDARYPPPYLPAAAREK